MRSTFKDVLRWIGHIKTPHPPAELLLGLLDGQLDSEADATVRSHLAGCIACQERVTELQEGIELFESSVTPSSHGFSVEDGLNQLLSTIRERETSPGAAAAGTSKALSPVVYDRLLSELSIYVGRPTATQLLKSSTQPMPQRDRLAAVVEPVITGFFGQHTGAAVVANVLRIWDHAQQVAS